MNFKKKIIFNASCTLDTPAGIGKYCRELSFFFKESKSFDIFFFLKNKISKNIPNYKPLNKFDYKKYFRQFPMSYKIRFHLENFFFSSFTKKKNLQSFTV